MEEHNFETLLERLKDYIGSARQNWLLGAGISYSSNIPLMYPLTERVLEIVGNSPDSRDNKIIQSLTSDLDSNCHVEHYLSHLGDLIAISGRSKSKSAKLGNDIFSIEELNNLYMSIIKAIGETVRYGYKKNKSSEDIIGTSDNPQVEIDYHRSFIEAIYSNRSNLTSRSNISFFTTNYDTLLEDALSLTGKIVLDGFSGGAIGFWNPKAEFERQGSLASMCSVYKLHGSIDWHKDSSGRLLRVRYGTKYLANTADIMIYPQATKYIETQKDPFSYLFSRFRNSLNVDSNNVLITCGYSFGDEHINAEIEAALTKNGSSLTLITFTNECLEGECHVNMVLDRWIKNEVFGDRVYVAGKKGLYYRSLVPKNTNIDKELSWWTFEGLTKFILTGNHE